MVSFTETQLRPQSNSLNLLFSFNKLQHDAGRLIIALSLKANSYLLTYCKVVHGLKSFICKLE